MLFGKQATYKEVDGEVLISIRKRDFTIMKYFVLLASAIATGVIAAKAVRAYTA